MTISKKIHKASFKLTGPLSMRGDSIYSLAPKVWLSSRLIAVVVAIHIVFLSLVVMARGDSVGTTISGLFSITISLVLLRHGLALIRIFLEVAVVISKNRK